MRGTTLGGSTLLLALATIAGCGDATTPGSDGGGIDAGRDGGAPIDATAPQDASRDAAEEDAGDASAGDAGAGDAGADDAGADSGSLPDACVPPPCPPPPPGCSYVGSTPCTCGTLDCPMPTGPCEGSGSMPCTGAEYCMYPDGMCGGNGTCTARPDLCPDVYMPVCGCDGVTYSNGCEAAANEQSIAFDGECPEADCRSSGCPGGQSCQACLSPGGVSYVCLPDGSIC